MTVKSRVRNDRKPDRLGFRRSSALSDKCEALDKSTVAELSAAVINDMTYDELVRMIRVADLRALHCPDLDRHFPFFDHMVLKRLAFLARRCCRNQAQHSLAKDGDD